MATTQWITRDCIIGQLKDDPEPQQGHPVTRKRLLYRLLLLCALLVISYLAFTPIQIPVAASLNDKVSHIAAFLCLAQLSDFAWPERSWYLNKFLPLLLYGLFIECVQSFLPYREFSLWDLLADAFGLMLYAWVLPYLLRHELFRRVRD
ncbi:MAG: VanZ family protein [Candidatus Thiodiazotropha sp.]